MSEAQIVRVAWAGCSAQCVIIMMCWWEANNCVCARVCVCLPVDSELFHLMLTEKRCVCAHLGQMLFHASQYGLPRSKRAFSLHYYQSFYLCKSCTHVYTVVSVKVLHTTRFVSVKHSQIHHPCFLLALGFLAGSALPLKPADVLTLHPLLVYLIAP